MSILREYIRELLLTESIDSKILGQLDKLIEMDGFIGIQKIRGNQLAVEAKVFSRPMWKHDVGYVYALHGGAAGPCNNALIIGGPTMEGEGTSAQHGIGPLLYDVLMEAASFVGKDGLGPDYEHVSNDAYALWDYYLNNRSDVVAKQRDVTQDPRTPDPADDCTANDGYRAVAKRFPGGAAAAYGSEPSYDKWDKGKQHPKNPEGNFSPEFLDHWFDPANPLTKTYHKKGTPLIGKLRQDLRLLPSAATALGVPYTQEEMQEVWDNSWGNAYPPNHEKIPWISGIWAHTSGFDQTLLKELTPNAPWEKFS